jgi:hypothetical protein
MPRTTYGPLGPTIAPFVTRKPLPLEPPAGHDAEASAAAAAGTADVPDALSADAGATAATVPNKIVDVSQNFCILY